MSRASYGDELRAVLPPKDRLFWKSLGLPTRQRDILTLFLKVEGQEVLTEKKVG